MSLRFHVVVCEVDPGNEYFMCKRVGGKMTDEKILLRSSARCLKRMYLESGVSVSGEGGFVVLVKTFFDFVI